jgi:outer membrane protein TolC
MTPTGLAPARTASAAADASAVDRTGVIPARLESVAVDPAAVVAEDPGVYAAVDSVVSAVDTVATRRSSTRQAQENVEAQRSQLRITRAQRLPAVSLSTTYQRFAYPSNGLPSALDQFFPNWTVSLGVSVPLFTGGRIRGEELVAQANVREAEQQAQQVTELAALDAQLAVSQLEQAEAAWRASAGTSEQASRAYQISEVRYREGIATQIELSDSRLLLQQAQWNTATAARDLEIARMRLRLLRDLPLQAGGSAAQSPSQQQGTGGTTGGASGGAAGGQQQTPRQNQAPQQAAGAPTGQFGGGNQ